MAVGLEKVKKMVFRKAPTQTHAETDYDLHNPRGVDDSKQRRKRVQRDAIRGYDIHQGY